MSIAQEKILAEKRCFLAEDLSSNEIFFNWTNYHTWKVATMICDYERVKNVSENIFLIPFPNVEQLASSIKEFVIEDLANKEDLALNPYNKSLTLLQMDKEEYEMEWGWLDVDDVDFLQIAQKFLINEKLGQHLRTSWLDRLSSE